MMISIKRLALTLLMFGVTSAGLAVAESKTITVSSAASLKDAMTAAGAMFEKENPGMKVRLNFASSSQIASQIEHGAPIDVFASADNALVTKLATAGLISSKSVLARNRIALIVSQAKSADIRTVADLAKPGVRIILTPPQVPIAKYTRQYLQNMDRSGVYGADFSKRVMKNVVSEEPDVRMVAMKVAMNEADAGFVFVSDVTKDIKPKVTVIQIPAETAPTAEYGIGIIKINKDPAAAERFFQFMVSRKGQSILKNHGLLTK